jgi:hypothetical protein
MNNIQNTALKIEKRLESGISNKNYSDLLP